MVDADVEAEQTVLADDDRDAVRDKRVVRPVEGVDEVLLGGGVEAGEAGHVHAEWPEPVEMDGCGDVRVMQRGQRGGEGVEPPLVPVGEEGGQYEQALGVPAARRAHDPVEGRVELVEQLVALGVAGGAGELRFVEALEDQLARRAPERSGDLRPAGRVPGEDVVVVGGQLADPQPGVVMHIDHHVQAAGQRPSHTGSIA